MKKTDYDTKISEAENKVSDHNHEKYIITPEFNILATRIFTKTDFDAKLQSLHKKIYSNKTKHLLTETEFKNYKNLMQPILEAKIILMVMTHKII